MDDQIRKLVRDMRDEVESAVNVDEALADFDPHQTAPLTTAGPQGSRRVAAWWGAAAAVVLALIGGIVILRGTDSLRTEQPDSGETTVTSVAPEPDTSPATCYKTVATCYKTVATSVTGQSPSDLDLRVEIDRGSSDGLRVGMPVIDESGLVGKIVRTEPQTSVVMLVTDSVFQVLVTIATANDSTSNVGRLTGAGSGEPPLVRLLEQASGAISLGDGIVTAGGPASLFPPDLSVGKVINIEPEELEVELDADLDHLDQLFVILYVPDVATDTVTTVTSPAPSGPDTTTQPSSVGATDFVASGSAEEICSRAGVEVSPTGNEFPGVMVEDTTSVVDGLETRWLICTGGPASGWGVVALVSGDSRNWRLSALGLGTTKHAGDTTIVTVDGSSASVDYTSLLQEVHLIATTTDGGDTWTVGTPVATDELPPGPTTPPPTSEPSALDWQTMRWEGSGLACEGECPQLRSDADGSLVTYAPESGTLTRHTSPRVTTTVSAGAQLVAVGPDDVVYLLDGSTNIIAVALAEGDAGRVITRWNDLDSTEVRGMWFAGPTGVSVRSRPLDEQADLDLPTAVVVPWVDRSGTPVAADLPVVTLGTRQSEFTVTRTDQAGGTSRQWTFQPPASWFALAVDVIPTFDGGFVASSQGIPDLGSPSIVRGWVDGSIDMVEIDGFTNFDFPNPSTIDRSGRFYLPTGEFLAVAEPFPDRTTYWEGQTRSPGDPFAVELPGIDSLITIERPAWALDPVAFGNAVAGPAEVNERRTITVGQGSATDVTVIVTTTNFYDDSGFGGQLELDLNRSNDGTYEFISGQYSVACQPGRGHQDFRPEPCL